MLGVQCQNVFLSLESKYIFLCVESTKCLFFVYSEYNLCLCLDSRYMVCMFLSLESIYICCVSRVPNILDIWFVCLLSV